MGDVVTTLETQIYVPKDSVITSYFDNGNPSSQYWVAPTRWHIDDIRDRFPEGTSDDELYGHLESIEKDLTESSIKAGWGVIDYAFPSPNETENNE